MRLQKWLLQRELSYVSRDFRVAVGVGQFSGLWVAPQWLGKLAALF